MRVERHARTFEASRTSSQPNTNAGSNPRLSRGPPWALGQPAADVRTRPKTHRVLRRTYSHHAQRNCKYPRL